MIVSYTAFSALTNISLLNSGSWNNFFLGLYIKISNNKWYNQWNSNDKKYTTPSDNP